MRSLHTLPADCASNTIWEHVLTFEALHDDSTRKHPFAYAYSEDGLSLTATLTREEWLTQVLTLAATLRKMKASGERALLVYPPGLDFVVAMWACLAAGVVAVPCPTPNPYRLETSLARLRTIATDSQARFLLTTTKLIAASDGLPLFEHKLTVVPTDHITAEPPTLENTLTPVAPYQEALLQYTSGSTQTPRGVCVTAANLQHNLEQIHTRFGHDADSVGVIWLPHYHDMGLIGGILQPAYGDFPVILMPPYMFLQHPFRWLNLISTYGATTSGGPNFAYDHCVKKILPAQRQTLNLQTWKVAFNGAEPIQAETLERFIDAFQPHGFHPDAFFPCYGLAENTLIATGDRWDTPLKRHSVSAQALAQHQVRPPEADETAYTLIGCGVSLTGQTIRIVNPDTGDACQPGQIGEIWLHGPSVALGYWQQPEATQQLFQARLLDGTDQHDYLRTGDLGFLAEDQLYVTGRLKDLMIMDGANYYPQDFEQVIERAHDGVKPGGSVVFQVESRLIALIEVLPKVATDTHDDILKTIRKAVQQELGLSLQQIVLVKTHSLPKTSSGKRQRQLARTLYLEQKLERWP